MTRTTHGIWTDVASIIVGDPCRLLPSEAWQAIIEQRWRQHQSPDSDPKSPLLLPDYGLLVPTVENCDGWTKVDVYRNKEGWPTRLVVNLNSLVRKPG